MIESLKYSELKYLDDLKGVVSVSLKLFTKPPIFFFLINNFQVYLFTIKRHSSELIKARSDVLTQRVESLLECQKKFGCDLVSVYSIEDLSACFTQHVSLKVYNQSFTHLCFVCRHNSFTFMKSFSLMNWDI